MCDFPGPHGVILPVAGNYVVTDPCQATSECMLSVWVYEESNGMGGLQRADDFWDQTCEVPAVDSLVFGVLQPWPAT